MPPRKPSTKPPSKFPEQFRDAQSTLRTYGYYPYVTRRFMKYYVEHERLEQAILKAWCMGEEATRDYSEARYIYHCPNGEYRDIRTVMPLALMGVEAGIPDLLLPVSRGGYLTLYLEMKRKGKGKQEPEQEEWQATLERLGHCYRIAYTWEQGRDIIMAYLDGRTVKGETNNHG